MIQSRKKMSESERVRIQQPWNQKLSESIYVTKNKCQNRNVFGFLSTCTDAIGSMFFFLFTDISARTGIIICRAQFSLIWEEVVLFPTQCFLAPIPFV